MVKNKAGSVYASATFDGFPLLNAEKRCDGTHSAEKMVNFRPLADGSLEKRCGYESVLTMPASPRAVYAGFVLGEEVFYFLAGSSVFRRYPDDEYGYVYAGRVESTEGDAAFSEFFGKLWLFDGDDVYVLTDGVFEAVEGYIPLYGRNWDPLLQGEIHEAENLMTPRIRLHYKNPEKRDTVYFGRRVVSIHRVWLDGVETPKTDVELLATGHGCVSESFIAAGEIELLVTLDVKDERARISACRRAIAYGGARDNRLFCWDGADPSAFYASRAVGIGEAEYSDACGGGVGGALYFPSDAEIYRVDAPVTAVCRYFDRLLIFTASGAWAADCSDSTDFEVTPVHSTVGCDKKDCAVLCGNAPVTYFGGKLWRWSARSTTQRECSAEVLSSPVARIAAEMRRQTVLMQYYGERSELWVACAGDEDGRVLIYNTEAEGFYTFDGVYAEMLVPSVEEPLLVNGSELFAFRDALSTDPNEKEIKALYRSGWFDFGHPEKTKRISRFYLAGDPDGGRLTVRFLSERGQCAAVDLFGRGDVTRNAYDRRVSVGRLRYLSVSLESGGTERPTVSALTVTARK